jgi:hypothetical protein
MNIKPFLDLSLCNRLSEFEENKCIRRIKKMDLYFVLQTLHFLSYNAI